VLAPLWSPDAHYFLLSGVHTLVVACESTYKNRVLRAIYDDLKRGAGQLSGTRPSILACQIEDIYDEDWPHLQGRTGLTMMSNRLLHSSERSHVNFVVYSSNRTPPQTDAGITDFSVTNLRFENRKARHSFRHAFFPRITIGPNGVDPQSQRPSTATFAIFFLLSLTGLENRL
jgi:hypothetical protein